MQRFGRGARDKTLHATCLLLVEDRHTFEFKEKKRVKALKAKERLAAKAKTKLLQVPIKVEPPPSRQTSPSLPALGKQPRENSIQPSERSMNAAGSVGTSATLSSGKPRCASPALSIQSQADSKAAESEAEDQPGHESASESENDDAAADIQVDDHPVGSAIVKEPKKRQRKRKASIGIVEDLFVNAGSPGKPTCRRAACDVYFGNSADRTF